MSVVISTYGLSNLKLALEGFRKQEFNNFEIIIVNDGGDDFDLSEFSDLNTNYIYFGPYTKRFRLAQARNIGIDNARGKRVIFTDADCIPSRTFLNKHADHANDDRVVIGMRSHIHQAIAGKLQKRHVDIINKYVFKRDARISKLHTNPIYYYFLEYFAFGCNVSYDTKTLKKLGGFSDDFVGWGYEDIELATRARYQYSRIFRIYHDCLVYHLDHKTRSNRKNMQFLIKTRDLLKCPIISTDLL